MRILRIRGRTTRIRGKRVKTHMSINIFSDPKPWWRGISPGDTVRYSTPQGGQGKGKVTIAARTHVVLNTGGRHGTPKVVDDSNYVSHESRKPR